VRIIALFLLLSISTSGLAQYKRKPKNPFPKPPRFEQVGWYVDPGASYTLTGLGLGNSEIQQPFNGSLDTTLVSTFDPNGQVGAYLGAGRYHIINNLYFFRYLDYGIHYKMLRGREEASVAAVNPQTSIPLSNSQNEFTDHVVGINFNISNVIPLTDRTFIQNSFGIAADYHLLQNRTNGNVWNAATYPNDFRGDLNYKLGFGFKPNNWLLIIPSVQTSLLNLYPFRGAKFSLPYFSSEYKPLFISIRFLWLNTAGPKYCPPVDALGVPEGMEEQQ
jgi:hypothetical protein